MIVHIAEASAWASAQDSGEYRPRSLATHGFIHCSDPGQVVRVADQVYRGRTDLVLLWVDPSRLRHPCRYEDGGNGEAFPHVYGALNVDAVMAVQRFAPRADGTFDTPSDPLS